MDNVVLILARHGETLENRQHVLQGQQPGTLSPLGKHQALELAHRLQDVPLDAVVSSDLARSYDTALVVAHSKGIEPQRTPLLREMDWGIYTGKSLEDVDWLDLPESVESVQKLYERAGEFILYLRTNYAGKRVLAVGHGAINRAILTWLEGQRAEEMVNRSIMENTEIVVLTILNE